MGRTLRVQRLLVAAGGRSEEHGMALPRRVLPATAIAHKGGRRAARPVQAVASRGMRRAAALRCGRSLAQRRAVRCRRAPVARAFHHCDAAHGLAQGGATAAGGGEHGHGADTKVRRRHGRTLTPQHIGESPAAGAAGLRCHPRYSARRCARSAPRRPLSLGPPHHASRTRRQTPDLARSGTACRAARVGSVGGAALAPRRERGALCRPPFHRPLRTRRTHGSGDTSALTCAPVAARHLRCSSCRRRPLMPLRFGCATPTDGIRCRGVHGDDARAPLPGRRRMDA